MSRSAAPSISRGVGHQGGSPPLQSGPIADLYAPITSVTMVRYHFSWLTLCHPINERDPAFTRWITARFLSLAFVTHPIAISIVSSLCFSVVVARGFAAGEALAVD